MRPDLASVPNSWMTGLQLEQYKLSCFAFGDVNLMEMTFCTEIHS